MTAYCMLIIFHISWDFPGFWIPRDFLLKLGHFWSCYETCDFIKTLFYQASSDTPLKGKGRWNSVIASWGTEVKIPHLASINAQRGSLFLGQGESSGCLLGLCRNYARWKGQSWLLLSPVWPLLTYWGDGGLASVPLGSGENPDFPVGPSATRQAREGRRLNTTRLGAGPDSHTISNNYGRAFAVFNKNFVLLHIFLALQRFFLGLFWSAPIGISILPSSLVLGLRYMRQNKQTKHAQVTHCHGIPQIFTSLASGLLPTFHVCFIYTVQDFQLYLEGRTGKSTSPSLRQPQSPELLFGS